MSTIVTLAKEMNEHFTTVTRDNGDVIYKLNDSKADWMTDVIYTVHDGMLPDDWTYETIRDVVSAISELETDSDEDEVIEAIDEIEPEYRNYQLCLWLAGNMEYADKAIKEFGPFESTFDLLQAGNRMHIQEIGYSVMNALKETIENEESEDEDTDE